MSKAEDAYRTIGEVSDWLETPAHVLRFWESKFNQIRPIKRAGGRRYYRPEDITLLGGIKFLLHEEGMTIKGVQKLLRERGVGHVSALSAHGAFGTGDQPQPESAAQDGGEEVATAPVAPPAKAVPPPGPAAPAPTPAVTPALRAPGALAQIIRADRAVVRRRKTRIAPLVARLQEVRIRISEG